MNQYSSCIIILLLQRLLLCNMLRNHKVLLTTVHLLQLIFVQLSASLHVERIVDNPLPDLYFSILSLPRW